MASQTCAGRLTSNCRSGMSSPTGTPVERSMTSILMGASHFALSVSFTRYLGAKLTLHRLCGLCSHRTHCGSRQPKLLQKTKQQWSECNKCSVQEDAT